MIKKFLSFLLYFFLLFSAVAQIPAGYYNNASNKSGDVLRAALRDVVTAGSVKLPYTSSSFDVWQAYSKTDVRPGTTIIWDMYSDIPGGNPPYNYTLYTGQCGTSGAEGDCYSREHQVPNSWWGGLDDANNPQYTDLHHLPPADQYVNNRKSAHPIGQVGAATWTSINGSKVGPCSWPGYTGVVFEPINEYKGDFARAYLYVATRYMNVLSSWVTNYPGNESQYVINSTGNNYKQWFVDMLIRWHLNDPVSQKEIDRNNAIYYNTPQRNRNPYIDHPEYVCMVWTSTSCLAGPSISNIVNNPVAPISSSTVSVTATVTSPITLAVVNLEWGTDGVNFPNSISMTASAGNDFVTSSSIPAQSAGATVYYRVIAEDIQSNATTSSVRSYKVLKGEPSSYPTSFSCGTVTGNSITLTWTDATGTFVPDGYLIKASGVSASSITDPSDSVTVSNGSFVKNVAAGVQQVTFSGFGSQTTYYFKIYPYTNSGIYINYRTSATPPAVSCTTLVSAGGSSCATDLIISEYVEGSINNKYIEIYNNTGAAVNLADYQLRLFTNGATTASTTNSLSGTLNNQGAIVYRNTSATIYSGTSTVGSAVNFNGDDAIALFKVSTNAYVDIFGRIGERPTIAWTSGSFSTFDKTLVRNSNVYSGVTVNPSSGFPTLSTEWTQFPTDTISNLGIHAMSCPVCASPTALSSGITFSSVSQTSMTINWTSGDGAKRLVVMREASPVGGLPVDLTTYTANAIFGSGDTLTSGDYIVYNNNGNSVSVSNLSAGQTYYISVFEYNCSVGNEAYLTPGTTSSQITYSIVTGPSAESQYCITPTKGFTTAVDFSSTGTFTGNTYSVQLSDSSGSFSAPVVIGTLSSNLQSGTINCNIPANTASGSGYRFRVVSNGPSVTGTTSGTFSILLTPDAVAPVSLSVDRSGFCSTDSGNIVLTANGGSGSQLSWYSGSCGGTFLGTGTPLVIPSPLSTTTYFAYWANTCSTSPCTSLSVSVSGLPSANVGLDISSCSGAASIAMTGASASGGTNTWSGGSGLGTWTQNTDPALATFTPSVPGGSFIATLTVFSSGGCANLSASYARKISWGTSGTWTGAYSSEWSFASNWCGGVPSSTSDITIPETTSVLFSPVISTISSACRNMNLKGSLTITSGFNLDVNGNWVTNNGTLGTTGRITFRGGARTISGSSSANFPDLFFNSGSTYTMSNNNTCSSLTLVGGNTQCSLTQSAASLTVSGNVSVQQPTASGTNSWNINNGSASVGGSVSLGSSSNNSARIAKVNITSGNLTVTGNLTFNASASFTTVANLDLSGGAATVNLSGSLVRNSAGTITPGTQSVFNFNGSSTSQTIFLGTGFGFCNLNLNNTSSSGVVLNAAVTSSNVTGNISVQSGLFSNNGFAIAGNTARQFSVSSGATFRLTGSTGMPTGFGTTSLGSSSTVEFAGTGSQTVSALTYGNLMSSGTGTRVLASSGTIGLLGAFTPGTNTYTITGSTISFNGSNQSVPELSTSGYNRIIINQSSGTAAATGNITMAGKLTLTAGSLNIGNNILLLNDTATVGGTPFSSSKMIILDSLGEVRKKFSANGTYFFPIGDIMGVAEYSPVSLSLTSSTYGSNAYAGMRVANGKHPANAATTNYLNRYWTLNTSGITSPVSSATFTFLTSDVIGLTQNMSSATYRTSLPWTKFSTLSSGAQSMTFTDVSLSGATVFSAIPAAAPIVSISGGSLSVCSGDSLQLTANPTGLSPFSYQWTGVNAVYQNMRTVWVKPSSNTTYSVLVTDANGFTASASASVTVNAVPDKPLISLSGPSAFCNGGSVTLTSTTANSYLWNNASVTRSIGVTVGGSYFVTVLNASGCSATSDPVTVQVNNSSRDSSLLSLCSHQLPYLWNGLSLTATGIYKDTLMNAAGCDSVVIINLTVLQAPVTTLTASSCQSYLLPWDSIATTSGLYSKTYPGAAANGCDSVVSINLTINPLPQAGTLTGNSTVCINDTVRISSNGNVNGIWQVGDTAILRSLSFINNQATLIARSAGVSSLRYVVVTSGCGSDTARINITVNQCTTAVNVKLYLQGSFVRADSLRPSLVLSGVPGANMQQADSVSVEIRNGLTGALLGGPVKTILLTNGTATAVFPALNRSHYIVVKHRNSIEVWSADTVFMGAPVVNYDFTTARAKAYASNQAQVIFGSNIYAALWSGDLNQDGVIESSDYTKMENDVIAILFGYGSSDITGDGAVEASDYLLMENNIPKIILTARPF